MAELHKALECLRPKDFSDIPVNDLSAFLPEILANAQIIANSVPPPPNGTPYEQAQRSRNTAQPAFNAADLSVSSVRRPPPAKAHAELQKAWGKPLKLGNKETATGMSVFKMAGHDRHGAWFSRNSVHEGLGFDKWKRAMMREFPESLAVQGGPGEGNVRGIGGDQRLEEINVDGVGKLEVYQLSAQFPGPTSPREFITMLITSSNCLTDASQVGSEIPRHYMVVSIPVSHPDAPPRNGMVRGFYESIEMIREIPLSGNDDPETNPVEWIMVTRSDPGGGIPRFMVERNVPTSIVQDAVKFLDWACPRDDLTEDAEKALHAGETSHAESTTAGTLRLSHEAEPRYSLSGRNGAGAGVGTSIAEIPSSTRRRASHRTDDTQQSYLEQLRESVGAYIPDALNPMPQTNTNTRTDSDSSSISSSSVGSFASAEQFTIAPQGLPIDDTIPTPSTLSEKSLPIDDSPHARELAKLELKKAQLREKLDSAREKQGKDAVSSTEKSQKEIERAAEKHTRSLAKQEEKFSKEIRKLEQRREKETKKLLLRQQKDADKNKLAAAQRERDEFKQQLQLVQQENTLLKDQLGELQRENTALVARIGKTELGKDILKLVKEEDLGGRERASSGASMASQKSAGRRLAKVATES